MKLVLFVLFYVFLFLYVEKLFVKRFIYPILFIYYAILYRARLRGTYIAFDCRMSQKIMLKITFGYHRIILKLTIKCRMRTST